MLVYQTCRYFLQDLHTVMILRLKICSVMLLLALNLAWPRGYKTFSCSTLLSMKIFLLINVKMPTVVGILTIMSGENCILDLSEHKKAEFLEVFILMRI